METQVSSQAAARPPQEVVARPDTRQLGEILLEMGVCNADQLAEALAAQHLEDERVGETLVRLKYVTDWDVCQALGRQFGLPVVDKVEDKDIQDELVGDLPMSFARNNMVLPWVVTPWGRAPWLRYGEEVATLDGKKKDMERFANKVIHR